MFVLMEMLWHLCEIVFIASLPGECESHDPYWHHMIHVIPLQLVTLSENWLIGFVGIATMQTNF